MKVTGDEYINIDKPFEVLDNKSIQRVTLKIEASHAGVVNSNYMFYTPKALQEGSKSLKEFYKPLQKKHYSKTLGYIYDAYYQDNNLKTTYLDNINNSSNATELVQAANAYVESPDYSRNKKGFGFLVSKAKLYDKQKIEELQKNSRGTVSIAGGSDLAYCNVCAKDFNKCKHKLGTRYNGRTCFAVVDSLGLDHISFETIPADWESNTVIVQDSHLMGTIEVTDYKIQKGTLMKLNLNEFKEKLLNTELILEELGLSSFSATYQADLEKALNSQYALPAEKLLPVNTKLTAFVAKEVVLQLEESEDKEIIEATINEAYTNFFGNLSQEEAKESLSVIEEEIKEVELTNDVEDVPVVVEEPVTPVTQTQALEVTDAASFILAVQDAFDAKLDEAVSKLTETLTKEQTTKGNQILMAQIEAYKADLQAAKVFEDQLTSELRLSILNQIKTLKNIEETSEYFQKLSTRTIQELKMTLEDHVQLFNQAASTPVIETTPVVVQDAQATTQADTTTAVAEMNDNSDELEITDADKVVNTIISGLTSEKIERKEFHTLYKATVVSHGSTVAKKLHNVLKQNNRI